MAVEMRIWRADGNTLHPVEFSGIKLETQLETYLESDPAIMGATLLIVGRQVATAFGGYIDLLALDADGAVHVLELKRDRTPRDVTAQALDYGSWVSTLGREQILEIFSRYRPGLALEEAFAEQFGTALPEEINTEQVLTIVAASIDSATERIVKFLNEDYGVPINVIFFRHFEDRDTTYLARSWLVDQDPDTATGSTKARKTKSRETWNGSDWYVAFGEYDGGRQWEDARQYGFVSGGGERWYSRTLKNLVPGARIFVHIPKNGYVAVGTVAGEAQRFDETVVAFEGAQRPLNDLPLIGNYRHPGDDADAIAEWAVPVTWTHTVSRDEAVWKPSMYANQNTVTKLRNQYTIQEVTEAFGLQDEA